ncbi:MAG: prepilin peptidase [Clostridia bacterium]|nr:prepilin peptidase [Clostridia bacterium]
MINIISYTLIFIIGTLFGSFSTLAVYRLPLHENITHKHSYCPKCNHKLSFFDMIPILSYVFLGGKCRYCKSKIRIRYLLLEILTGVIFLLFAVSLNINFYEIELSKIVYLICGLLYLSGLIIISGIDKENIKINKPTLVYEITILSAYMIYLYIVENTNIYRYVIYLLVLFILFAIDTRHLRKYRTDNYTIEIVILSIIQAIFTYSYGFMITAIITILSIAFYTIIKKILKQNINNLPIGYYLCFANIITIILINILACRG